MRRSLVVSPAVLGVKIIHALSALCLPNCTIPPFPVDLAFSPCGVYSLGLLPAQKLAPGVFRSLSDWGDNEEVWRVQISPFDELQETIVFKVAKWLVVPLPEEKDY